MWKKGGFVANRLDLNPTQGTGQDLEAITTTPRATKPQWIKSSISDHQHPIKGNRGQCSHRYPDRTT